MKLNLATTLLSTLVGSLISMSAIAQDATGAGAKPPTISTKLKYLERKFHFDQCDRTFNFLKVDL